MTVFKFTMRKYYKWRVNDETAGNYELAREICRNPVGNNGRPLRAEMIPR